MLRICVTSISPYWMTTSKSTLFVYFKNRKINWKYFLICKKKHFIGEKYNNKNITFEMANSEISSGNKILDENVRNWLKWNVKGSKSYKHVEEMVNASKWKELEKIMVNRLAFGTAGLRGKMGPG